MKAGDLVRHYKEMVATEDGETIFYKKSEVGVVMENYEPWTKLIKIFCEGKVKVVHISEVTTLKRGAGWTKKTED